MPHVDSPFESSYRQSRTNADRHKFRPQNIQDVARHFYNLIMEINQKPNLKIPIAKKPNKISHANGHSRRKQSQTKLNQKKNIYKRNNTETTPYLSFYNPDQTIERSSLGHKQAQNPMLTPVRAARPIFRTNSFHIGLAYSIFLRIKDAKLTLSASQNIQQQQVLVKESEIKEFDEPVQNLLGLKALVQQLME